MMGQAGEGAGEVDKEQFVEALSPSLRGSGWVLLAQKRE